MALSSSDLSPDPRIRAIQEATEARGEGGGFMGDVKRSGLGGWLFGGDDGKNIAAGPEHGAQAGAFIQGQLNGSQGRPAPMFSSYDAADARNRQMVLANELRRIASGQQVGAGEMAVNRQVGQATAAQQAQMMMARGGNTALAARAAGRNTADIGVNGAGMAAQAQLQDATNAQNQLAGIYSGMRGQDISIGQGNQNAQLNQTGLNQQYSLGLLGQQLGYDQAALNQGNTQAALNAADKGVFGQLLAAGGQIGAAYAGK